MAELIGAASITYLPGKPGTTQKGRYVANGLVDTGAGRPTFEKIFLTEDDLEVVKAVAAFPDGLPNKSFSNGYRVADLTLSGEIYEKESRQNQVRSFGLQGDLRVGLYYESAFTSGRGKPVLINGEIISQEISKLTLSVCGLDIYSEPLDGYRMYGCSASTPEKLIATIIEMLNDEGQIKTGSKPVRIHDNRFASSESPYWEAYPHDLNFLREAVFGPIVAIAGVITNGDSKTGKELSKLDPYRFYNPQKGFEGMWSFRNMKSVSISEDAIEITEEIVWEV